MYKCFSCDSERIIVSLMPLSEWCMSIHHKNIFFEKIKSKEILRRTCETIDARSDCTFVGQEPRDSTLIG